MVTMGSMRGRRARRIGLGAGIAAFAAVVVVAAWTPSQHPIAPPAGSDSPSAVPHVSGPVVYYEVLDAEASRLMERRLDGHSIAREVASRTDAEYGRTWTVDPTGTTGIAVLPGVDDQRLDAVSIATGAALWSARTPIAAVDQAAWADDGRHLGLATIGGDVTGSEAVVIDVASGAVVRVAIPDDAILQGFDRDGALVLRQRVVSPEGVNVGWRFLRVDPATATLERLVAVPVVGPASDGPEDVDPAAGLAVDTTVAPEDKSTLVRLWSIGGGGARTLATLPSVDRIGFEPGGTGVAISTDQSIRFVELDGRSTELFGSPDPIDDFAWSAGGDYLAVATERRGPRLTVVERATGRSVELPQPAVVAQLLLVRVIGGVALPDQPLPTSEPSPSPTPGPSGADIAGFDGLLSGWVDRTGTTLVAHVQRLVPTEGGGLRVAAEMPPLELEPVAVPDDGGPGLALLPRPGSSELLVWVAWSDRASGWLWDGAAELRPLPLPANWPVNAYDVAWRPDGGAIAASATVTAANGDTTEAFAVAAPAARTATIVPAPADYDRLEGWWSSTELRVGHVVCTEGCNGRFSYSARLRIRDHRLVELGPADRAHGPVDGAAADRGMIVLSVINDDPRDDIVIDWPADLGSVDGLDALSFGADGRSLLVVHAGATGTDVYRIDDPIGRAVGGRLRDPHPVLLLHLAGRDQQVQVSPDASWATVVDRVENVRLVRMADGRSWIVDRERSLAWPGPVEP
jgi:hypothetical protein